MYDITKDFFKNANDQLMEGFLCDENQEEVKLLFILQEPHCINAQSFWVKDILHDRKPKGKNGNKILNTFTKLACFVLKEQSDRILEKCAFINLYPHDGESPINREGGFYETIRTILAINSHSTYHSDYREKDGINISEIAQKRIALLGRLGETNIRYIVTVADVFHCISAESNDPAYERIYRKNGRPFRIGSLRYDNRITVYEYYHPSASCVNYALLNDAIQRSIIS